MNGGQTIFSTPSISSIRSRSPFASWYAESSRRLHFQFPAITGVLTEIEPVRGTVRLEWPPFPISHLCLRPVFPKAPRVRHRKRQRLLRRERPEHPVLQLDLVEHRARVCTPQLRAQHERYR